MNKLAVMTGASRGIGLEAARVLQSNGYAVINIARTPCVLEGVENHCCDLSEVAQIESVVTAIRARVVRADVVSIVHNASVSVRDSYADMDVDAFNRVLKINVTAIQVLNKHLLPDCKKGSSVIIVGSGLSEVGGPGYLSYTTSKHAQAGIMRSLTYDLAGKGIHTCLICPGFTDTDMLSASYPDKQDLQDMVARMVSFQRLIQPEEIAEVIYFCAEHPVVNGSVLRANLGILG